MAWFDEASQYYASVTEFDALSQGDIVFAASVVVEPGTAEVNIAGPRGPGDRRVTLWKAAGDAVPAAPSLSASVRWGFAMVLPHPCAMDKQWNEAREHLVSTGMPEDEAIRQATVLPNLDKFVAIAPVYPIESLPAERRIATLQGSRLGYFPICPDAEMPTAYVDLNRISTVDVDLVPIESRVRALSKPSRARLQLSLSQFFAWRAKSRFGEIEAVVGKTVIEVGCIRKRGKVVATFVFADGTSLSLEGDGAPDMPPDAPERPARTRT